MSLTADTGVESSIPAGSHTFLGIGFEIISTIILLPLIVSYKRKYVHEVLVNHFKSLASLPKEKCG